jgi:hypothetical protein
VLSSRIPRTGVWVGKVEGTQAFVGVVVRNGRVGAYVCDSQAIAAGSWAASVTGARTYDPATHGSSCA